MAEAFPEESTISERREDGSRKIISVLLLASRWQFDTYGLSTINKSLVNNLRLVDPEAKTIKITCAVVEEDGKSEMLTREMLKYIEYSSEEPKDPEVRRETVNQNYNGSMKTQRLTIAICRICIMTLS